MTTTATAASGAGRSERLGADAPREIRFDPAALEAAATRTDAGPDAVVSRAFIRDVWLAVRNPGCIRLLGTGEAATPMVIA